LKRLSTGVLAAVFAAGFGLTAVNAQSSAATSHGNAGSNATTRPKTVAQAVPPADFGSPPSGEIPILFNDHHVYAKPDELKRNRVLAALVRGKTILVPLRSMFEQMGATVSYDPATKTADVSKPGADVKVTVGKPEVIINGESRPLDVPPEIYKGVIVVPVRVISEGMGAYVQWVPSRKIVVVRYVPPSPPPPPPPPPTPAATRPPTPRPSPPPPPPPAPPSPTPAPAATHGPEFFLAGDYLFLPSNYNEFSPGSPTGGPSWAGRIGASFPILNNVSAMAELTYNTWFYSHQGDPRFSSANNPGICSIPEPLGAGGNSGCVTVIGRGSQTFVPSFDIHDTTATGRIGIGIPFPRVYIAGAYLQRLNNYGYPNTQGFGVGIEKLPDFDVPFVSPFGSIYYYPGVNAGQTLQYTMMTYQAGVTFQLPNIPVFLEAGYTGEKGWAQKNAPANFSHQGGFVGLGVHF
jgi:hypothetical protein